MYTQQNYHQLQIPTSVDMTSQNSCYTTPSKESSMMLAKYNYYQANVSPASKHLLQCSTYQSPTFVQPTFTPSPPTLTPPITTYGFSQSSSSALLHHREKEYLSPATIVKRRIQFVEQPLVVSPAQNQTNNNRDINRQQQYDANQQQSLSPFMTEEFFRQILSRKQTETRNIATQTDNPQVTFQTQHLPIPTHFRLIPIRVHHPLPTQLRQIPTQRQ